MSNGIFERWAGRNSPRFQRFIASKDAYEEFTSRLRVQFDKMTEHDYVRAREDPRLTAAARGFTEALEMSEAEGEIADVAVARYQMGLVHHARGDLNEAERLMRDALDVLGNLPRERRLADISACRYHLGVIALKRGRLDEAVRELRRTRQIDEATGDFQGVAACDSALATCAEAGADMQADSPTMIEEADSSWEFAEPETEANDDEDQASEFQVKPGRISSNRRELINLVSYSFEANDALMTHLESLGDEFGRPVAVSRVAFGETDPEKRVLPDPEPDQHLCATILVLEKAGLTDRDFQELAQSCMDRVLAVADYRLVAYLYDLTIDELRESSNNNLLIRTLFDTAQIAESPSLEQLRRTLVPFIRQVEHIQAAARWSSLRMRLSSVCGHAATVILLAAVSLSLLGFPAWLAKMNLNWLGSYGPPLSSLVFGVVAFPLQSPLIFLLLRGMRTVAFAPRDNALLRRWVVVGVLILLGASHFQSALAGPQGWLLLGILIGILLDSIRRAGYHARRQMIDLDSLRKTTNDPETEDPKATLLRGDPLNPFSCPLMPPLLARVFISYTRRSAKGSRLAASLHHDLKKAGASPFLDRASIPAGVSWRRALNKHLGECDTFVCILDEKSLKSDWVGAELLAAIEGHRLTSNPEIIIVLDPALKHTSEPMLPLFRGVLSAAEVPGGPGRPQLLQLNAQTQSSLAWALGPGQFTPTSVLTRLAAAPAMIAINLLAMVGGVGFLAGYVLGFMAVLEKSASFPLTDWLITHGWLKSISLMVAFWLGFNARATIAWGYEREHNRQMGVTIPALATSGLAAALFLFGQRLSLFELSWSAALLVSGWMMVASTIRVGVKKVDPRLR